MGDVISRFRDRPAGHSEIGTVLPDGSRAKGPFRPFTSDPGRSEAWWWLGLPLLVGVALVLTYQLAPEFYVQRVLPEGYGYLELAHFFIPLAGLVVALSLLLRPFVRKRPLILALAVIGALTCFYIAGEEHSWGQHFFHWQTPDYWAELNRQQETNLHNVMDVFDKKPRLLLEIGILIGGILVPLAARFFPAIRRNRWSLFLPADAILPVSLGAAFFKGTDMLQKFFQIPAAVARPAEATELYLYSFILFYLIMFARRVRELESEAGL
ncbi:MAG: hypothetical protein Kow0032_23220 [Methyloligellaceae bacterium]